MLDATRRKDHHVGRGTGALAKACCWPKDSSSNPEEHKMALHGCLSFFAEPIAGAKSVSQILPTIPQQEPSNCLKSRHVSLALPVQPNRQATWRAGSGLPDSSRATTSPSITVSAGRSLSASAICGNRLLKFLWFREYRIVSRLVLTPMARYPSNLT